MKNHARRMTAGLRDSIDALRRNNKLSYAAILGIAAAIVLGSFSWIIISLSIDAMAYIEQHGWQSAMERIDDFTYRLWKGHGKD
jgi:hypothetical protein